MSFRRRKTGEAPGEAPAGREPRSRPERGETFLPRRNSRRGAESLLVRLIATFGIIGVGTVIAAIMGTQEIDAWIVGVVVATVTVVLAAVLWSSRTM